MSTTYSLQNLLLDAPDLDLTYDLEGGGLLGPVVRMRWMSNLCRLAILEETDQARAAAGEYTEYDAEIRRLRRASMHPSAGRYYPVEAKAHRLFRQILPEQARQIVEHWLSRQPLPDNPEPEPDWREPESPAGASNDAVIQPDSTFPTTANFSDPESDFSDRSVSRDLRQLRYDISVLHEL